MDFFTADGDWTWQSAPQLVFVPLLIGWQGCRLAEDTPVANRIFVIRNHTDQFAAWRKLPGCLLCQGSRGQALLTQYWPQIHTIYQRPWLSWAPHHELELELQPCCPAALLPCCLKVGTHQRVDRQRPLESTSLVNHQQQPCLQQSRVVACHHFYLRIAQLRCSCTSSKTALSH